MSRVWVVIKRFGKLIKFLLICIVITVCVMMLWRIFSTGTPSELKVMMPNDKLREVYAEKGEDLYIFKQSYDNITRAEYNSGYFSVPDAVFIPEANQAQIVFRYNNSTITNIAKDYSLESVPDRNEDLFDVTLVFYIDLTPENTEDNDEIGSESIREVRVHANDSVSAKTGIYNFYRYSFDFDSAGVNMQELIDEGVLIAVHSEFYYKGAIDYEKRPAGALSLYNYRRSNNTVKLSGNDKKALTE